MKNLTAWLIAISLSCALIGCDSGGGSAPTTPPAGGSTPEAPKTSEATDAAPATDPSKLVLVSLNVPNMT